MGKIKGFLTEFKDFAMRGNVVDMAVGVIIGAAFGNVVTAVIDLVIQPILDAMPKLEGGGAGFAGAAVSLLGVLVNFILTAFVLFLIIKAMNSAKKLATKNKEEKPAAPTTKKCPYCFSEIAIEATRCPHCTSELKYDPSKKK